MNGQVEDLLEKISRLGGIFVPSSDRALHKIKLGRTKIGIDASVIEDLKGQLWVARKYRVKPECSFLAASSRYNNATFR